MRIVHVITGLPTGGAQTMLYNLATRMDARRFETFVVSLTSGGGLAKKFESAGIDVFEIGMRRANPSPASLFKLARVVRALRPQVLQGWMYHGNLAAQLVAARTPVVWNITSANFETKQIKPTTVAAIRLCGRLSALPRAIVNCSHFSAARHEELFGFRRAKRIVIPNGFDTKRFAPSMEARASVRAELRLEEDALLVGLMARHHPVKDHANFLRAAALVLRRHPQVNFVLAGEKVDESNDELCALREELKLEGRIHLLGEREDMPRLTAALDIAVSSSYSEAFPLVVGEAMACGVPCVVTDVGDSARVVGDAGRVVEPRDAEQLACALRELVVAGRAARSLLGERGRARVVENYSLDAVVRSYESLYEEVACGARDLAGEICAA